MWAWALGSENIDIQVNFAEGGCHNVEPRILDRILEHPTNPSLPPRSLPLTKILRLQNTKPHLEGNLEKFMQGLPQPQELRIPPDSQIT